MSRTRDEARWIATSGILVFFFLLILVFVNFGLYIEEAVDCRTFVSMLRWDEQHTVVTVHATYLCPFLASFCALVLFVLRARRIVCI